VTATATTSIASRPIADRRSNPFRLALPRLAPYALAGFVLTATYACSPNFAIAPGSDQGLLAGDFLQEWIGGWIVRHEPERLYDREFAVALEHDPSLTGFQWDRSQFLPMVYPPCWYLLVSPLATLPYSVAASIWAALMTGTMLSALLLLRAWVLRGDSAHGDAGSRTINWLLPVAVLYPSVIECLTSGQKSGLLLLLFSAVFLLLQRGQAFRAGLLGGLLLFKPHFCLILLPYMLLRRAWTFLGGFAVTAVVLTSICLAMGAGLCLDYLRFLAGVADYVRTAGYPIAKSHSLYGALVLFASEPTFVVRCLFAILATAIAFDTIAGTASIRRSTPSTLPRSTGSNQGRADTESAIGFAALILATLLTSPHLLGYDLTLILFPAATFLRADVRVQLGSACKPTAWLCAGMLGISGVSPQIAAACSIQLTTLLMLALWLALRRKRESSPVCHG